MDEFELISVIWETIMKSEKAMMAADVAEHVGEDEIPVRTALAKLRKAGLVVVEEEKGQRCYGRRVSLDPMTWARAVDLGVDINLLESLAEIQGKERQEALKLATSGEVDRVKAEEADQQERLLNEEKLGRLKSKWAASELGRLISDAKHSLSKHRQEAVGEVDQAALALLEEAVAEGDRVWETLQKNLLKE